jgi:hypothetical protein
MLHTCAHHDPLAGAMRQKREGGFAGTGGVDAGCESRVKIGAVRVENA